MIAYMGEEAMQWLRRTIEDAHATAFGTAKEVSREEYDRWLLEQMQNRERD